MTFKEDDLVQARVFWPFHLLRICCLREICMIGLYFVLNISHFYGSGRVAA